MNLNDIKNDLVKILEDKIVKLHSELNNKTVVSNEYKSLINRISVIRNLIERVNNLNYNSIDLFMIKCKDFISNNEVILELGELELNKVIEKIELYNLKKKELNFSLDIPESFSDIKDCIKSNGVDINSIKELKEIDFITHLFVERNNNIQKTKDKLYSIVNITNLHFFNNIEYKIKNNIELSIDEINMFKVLINKNDSSLFDNLILKIKNNIDKDRVLSLQKLIYNSFLIDIEEIEKFLNIKIDFNKSIEDRVLNIISVIDKINEKINLVSKKIMSVSNIFKILENQRKKDLSDYGIDLSDINLDEINEYNIYKVVYINEIYNYLVNNYNINRRKV